jgi:DNA-directed RNA polymerase alpha subunit
MDLTVSKVNVVKHEIEESKELLKLFKLIETHQEEIKNARSLLPKISWHTLSFELSGTYSAFANAIRRMLIEEIPTYCLDVLDTDIESNDEFILNDMLTKNINLLPVKQEIKDPEKASASLNISNNTNQIIDITSSDIQCEGCEIVDDNIIVIRLRPGKHLKIKKLSIIRGYGKKRSDKFSLLNNVQYWPIDHEPYDIKSNTGERSINKDPTEFYISCTTCGNIQLKTLVNLLNEELTERLTKILDLLTEYSKQEGQKFYYSQDLIVSVSDKLYMYKFPGEYITLCYMIAQKCYLLDPNVNYVAPSTERYDNENGIIRINHAAPNKLIISAVKECLKDVSTLYASLMKHIK